jgi:ribosomal protein S25
MSLYNSKIGMENESSLHRSLKFHYALPGKTEEERAGFICDAIGEENEAVEIQTGNFTVLKKKIPALLKEGKVRLIYPVIVNKTIELYDNEGNLVYKKKSPKKGRAWDIFNELIYAPALIKMRGLTIEIALVNATERRKNDGKGSYHRKGISIEDRILENIVERIIFKKRRDWQRFLPQKGEITKKTLVSAAQIKPLLAQRILYVLEKAGMVKKLGKQERSWVYQTV